MDYTYLDDEGPYLLPVPSEFVGDCRKPDIAYFSFPDDTGQGGTGNEQVDCVFAAYEFESDISKIPTGGISSSIIYADFYYTVWNDDYDMYQWYESGGHCGFQTSIAAERGDIPDASANRCGPGFCLQRNNGCHHRMAGLRLTTTSTLTGRCTRWISRAGPQLALWHLRLNPRMPAISKPSTPMSTSTRSRSTSWAMTWTPTRILSIQGSNLLLTAIMRSIMRAATWRITETNG